MGVVLSGAFFCAPGVVSWETASPESKGLNRTRLDRARDELAARGTTAFLVVRGGKIVYEWYAPDWHAGRKHYTASLAKALVGGLSLLLAWNDGLIHPDDPAWRYIPAWKGDPVRSKITIRHLATHSSGIEDAEQDGIPHMELPGWKGVFWRQDPEPFSVAIHEAPVLFQPGTEFHYSNPGMAALAYAVTAALRGTQNADIRTLLRERVMRRIGIPDGEWSAGYGKTFTVDGLPLVANWGGGNYTPRAVARVGQWMLQLGEWDGEQLVSPRLVEEVTQYAGTPLPERTPENPAPAPTLAWYSNFDGVWPEVPRDAFAGAGAGNQVLLVVPSLDLVVVRNGSQINPGGRATFWGGVVEYVFNPVMEAIREGSGEAPYPTSPVIAGVDFAPFEEIRCAAPGSDNWPLTWAGDDFLYASYGDGRGFAPFTEKKLSMGFARIAGSGDRFAGENIRTESGERLGDGRAGPKASGMLALDGVLYAWVRNTGNAQLIWSEDHGRSWRWGFRFTESFGSPAFLNFSRDYEGARDDYVYIYSQDGPSAYESDDGVVLARVPRDRIRERGAYEFFVRLGPRGEPEWTRDISRRGLVFQYPGRCRRLDAVYNAGLGRYLLAVAYDHDGGWGLFDAPEPWGPWTTAFHTPYWGLGQTHGYRLPSKWISWDGRTMYLVFSGRRHNGRLWDAFCVRRMTLRLR